MSSGSVSAGPVSAGPEDPESRRPIRRALVSVYDKTGLAELAQALDAAGVTVVSTGSTAAAVATAGVPVTRVEELTGFPESLDGRVKTLHPAVHAGLLADRDNPAHAAQLAELGMAPFDLLVSNLYPFAETVAAGGSPAECLEQIDIGGPAMVRSAAKNHATVAVVTSPDSYPQLRAALAAGGYTLAQRRSLAARAFADIAEYDLAVANWTAGVLVRREDPAPGAACWPEFGGVAARLRSVLRYGENPHQPAALYRDPATPAGVAQAEQRHGIDMSYINYLDADAAWRAVHDFTEPCVAIVKHATPCGLAVGADVAEAHRKAHASDPVSAFGSVIAANRPVSAAMAAQVAEVVTHVIVAPGYDEDALALLTARKNLRILVAPPWQPAGWEARPISGGLLLQAPDLVDAPGDDPATWQLVAGPAADAATLADLGFAWRAVRSIKSNAILLAAGGATVGIGMGQVNRVDAARLAVARAGADRAAGAVAASDAFFPFPDGLQVLIDAGVRAVAHPGGSQQDRSVTDAAAAAGLTLYLTGTRHFLH